MCAVVLVPWCTRKAFYKGKGCWIVFGGSFSHYCTAGHFVNGSLMIETTCARPRITFPFGSWSEGFSFTGGQEKKQSCIQNQRHAARYIWTFEIFWDDACKEIQNTMFLFFQPHNFQCCHEKRTEKCSKDLRNWSDVLWRCAETRVGFCTPTLAQLVFFKYFFLRMTVVGKAGQANKSRKEW